MTKEQRKAYYSRPEVKKKRAEYMKKYVQSESVKLARKKYAEEYYGNNKEEIKIKTRAYQKEWRDKNKEKLKKYRYDYWRKDIEKNRRVANERVKNPKDRERRRLNMINFRKRNPKYMSAYSMRYYFANQEQVDKTHAEWTKKAQAKYGSLYKRYGLGKNTPVAHALSRARGTKGKIEHQTNKSIEKDIQILKREITKLKENLKQ